jgi:3-isopropylmalate/(R)-2-methylmalate dehydratase small subunit
MTLRDINGRVAWIFRDDNFDVDQIIGVTNIKVTDVEELAGLAMKHLDPEFAKVVQPGDVLIGAGNFGYGHPHYPPMRVMRHLGISALIAESFAPAFYRGEISMGFPLITCPGILSAVSRWDTLSIDWESEVVANLTTGMRLPFVSLGSGDRSMLAQGGLIGYLKHRLQRTPLTS